MIDLKTPEQIKIMQYGGHILSDVLFKVLGQLKPGVTEVEIDQMAEDLIIKRGGESGFKKVKGYRHTVCVSTNDVVVHGIPSNYRFQEGDVVGVDCGVFYQGFHTDMSDTIRIKNGAPQFSNQIKEDDDIDRFLKIGKKALDAAIKVALPGNRVGHISKTIQGIVEDDGGYSVVRSLIGHGVGRQLHEEPEVPGYLMEAIHKTPLLKEGMTLAIEIIYNMGSADVILDKDGWTIRTKDGKLAGLYERTIAITKEGPVLLTV